MVLSIPTEIEKLRNYDRLSPAERQETLFDRQYMGKFLQEFLQHRYTREAGIVKPGPISHVDQCHSDTHPFTGEKEDRYDVLDPIAHRNTANLVSQVGFEQKRPLVQALRERGVISSEQVSGDYSETPERDLGYDSEPLPLDELCEGYSEVIFHPVNPGVAYLNHDSSIWDPFWYVPLRKLRSPYLTDVEKQQSRMDLDRAIREIETMLQSIQQNGTIGFNQYFPGSRPTYLKKYDLDGRDSDHWAHCGDSSGLYTVRFHVDVSKLMEVRDIYYDPETIWKSGHKNPEFKMTFRVFGGIPVSTIHSFDMWHIDKDEPPKIKLK